MDILDIDDQTTQEDRERLRQRAEKRWPGVRLVPVEVWTDTVHKLWYLPAGYLPCGRGHVRVGPEEYKRGA